MPKFVLERIQMPTSTVPGEKPPGTLQHGELWINLADQLVYAGRDGAAAVAVGGGGPVAPTPVVTTTADGLMSSADKVKLDKIDGTTKADIAKVAADLVAGLATVNGKITADRADVAALKTALAPILKKGFKTAGGVASAGGVPTLDAVGQIDPSMIGGTATGPARAGEVPKFKPNGKLDIGLIDWNFAAVSSPSTGTTTPTVADAGKLVRLDHQGKLDTSLLGLDPLDYRGELHIGPAGTALTGEVVDGAGKGGSIWIVAADGGNVFDVNFATGDVKAHATSVPSGYLEIKTGDLLVKDNGKKMHRINADLIPTAHLLPRDGSRPMIGDLVFQKLGSGGRQHEIKGVKKVSADSVHTHTLQAEMTAGTPGLPNGEILDFTIDGAKNTLIIRSGPDPTVGRVVGKKGEIYVDDTAAGTKIFFHDGVTWKEGVHPINFQVLDLTSEITGPTDDIGDCFGYWWAKQSATAQAGLSDTIFLANFSTVPGALGVYLCLERGGTPDGNYWLPLGAIQIPHASVTQEGIASVDGITIQSTSGKLALSTAIQTIVTETKRDLVSLKSDFVTLLADYTAYKAAPTATGAIEGGTY